MSKRAQSMATSLAYSSRLAVLTGDKLLLESVLENVTSVADFAYARIYGQRWTTLANKSGKNLELKDGGVELSEDERNKLVRDAHAFFQRFSRGENRYVEYIVPISSSESTLPYELQIDPAEERAENSAKQRQTIGAVRLALTMNRVDSQILSFIEWRAWSLAMFLCLSAGAIYIFSGRITHPINRLTQQAKRMSQGYLNEAILVDSHDEIGQLATAFNDMARALNDHYLGLEGKIAERTKELRAVNLKLAEASEHKSRFLANVNHELRTPLSSIIGYARLLRRETEGQITSLQRENLDDLLRNSERLLGLIDGLLDFAKIESGKIEVQIEPVNINTLIQSAAATVEGMLDKGLVSLKRDIPSDMPAVYTDADKLRQVVLNLLGNAVKFTDRGEIRISAYHNNGNISIAVADTGIGIEKPDIERIFDEFDRGRLTNGGTYRGTGLGLAIVKRLLDVLGGSIHVESKVGKGSTFTVILPLRRPETAPALL